MPRTLSTSYHIPPVWYTCVFSLYSTVENCLLSSYMKYIAPWFSFRNYYGFCFFTNKKRQKPWFYKVSDACLAGDERIELPPKVLETPIIPFDQSPIYYWYIRKSIWQLPNALYYVPSKSHTIHSISLSSSFFLSPVWLCPRPISNSQLHTLLHFHLCPIYLVVFKGSY